MTTRLFRFPGGKAKAVTLSYDDGVQSDIRLIEIMKQHGLKGTFNINGGLFAPEGTVYPEGRVHRRMSRSEIAAAYPEDTCEVACHGYTHPFLERCDSAVAAAEVIDDRRTLEALFNRRVQGMAYPYGTFNDQVVEILRLCGIRYCRTVISTERFDMPADWLRLPATCHHNNPKLMELADRFLSEPVRWDAKLFYLWGHSYEFDGDNNWDVIERFAEKIGGHEDIWYATNMEVYNAWHDYTMLESTADGKHVYNPTQRSVWFEDISHKLYEVNPGETVYIS